MLFEVSEVWGYLKSESQHATSVGKIKKNISCHGLGDGIEAKNGVWVTALTTVSMVKKTKPVTRFFVLILSCSF